MERVLVEFTLRAALIGAAAAVILKVLRIQTAAAQHAFWTGVLVIMLALPFWIYWGPKAALPVLSARGMPAALMTAASTVEADPSDVPLTHVNVGPESHEPASVRAWYGSGNLILKGIYLIGASVLLLRLAIGTIRANQLTSARCVVPVAVGFFRPRVILPECWTEWPAPQLDAVLTHERAHTRRRDPLVQWLALLNRAVFWFHPLAWWLERRLSALAEDVCDLAVLKRGHDPGDYLRYLLELSRVVQRAGVRVNVTGMAMPGSYLPRRVRRIVAGVGVPRIVPARMAAAACAGAICSAVFAAGTLERAVKVQLPSIPPVQIHVPASEVSLAPPEPVRTLAQVSVPQGKPASPAQTQGTAEQFEVASVKPSAPVLPGQRVYFGPARGGPGTSDPERITWSYARMVDLLVTAYDVKAYQVNGPGWITSERYDIAVNVPAGATQSQVRTMWQSLLAERFGVRLHHESKEFQVEELVVAKGGQKLKGSVIEDPDPGGPPQFDEKGQLSNPGQVITIKPGRNGAVAHAVARAQPLSRLTAMVGNQIGRPVLDKTGLNGKYDFDLEFTFPMPAQAALPGPAAPGDNDGEPGQDIAAALHQQLGLRLVPGKRCSTS